MKIALIDDEQKYLEDMEQICRDFGSTHQCRVETFSFHSGEDFLAAFDSGRFSLVFMDIYMNGMNGVDAAQKMRQKDSGCILIFLTSSMEFMPEAFSCHAFEYITKPFSRERVTQVLSEALKVLPPPPKYMEIISDRRRVPVLFSDIISAITDAHYLEIGLMNGTVLRSRMTMTEFLTLARDDPRFVPVNKGIVLNADYIVTFENNCCIMENNARFPIRIRDRLKVEQAVRDYHFENIRRHQRHGV